MKQNRLLCRIIAVVLALLLWQVLAVSVRLPILLVGPIEVLQRLATLWREPLFWESVWFTFYHIVAGFFLALLLGWSLGLLAGKFPLAQTLLWPYMACIKSVPVASIVVICLIWLSASNLSIFISFLIVLPIVYQNTLTGFQNQDPKMVEMAKIFHLTGGKKFIHITLPSMKSYLLAGASTGAGLAWKAGVAAEVIGTPNGSIGQQLFLSKIYLDTDDLLAWTFLLVVISVLFEKLVVVLLKKILP